mmetsp:Transcript_113279/g.300988  ORF Transcript_113279/g.300988 Transcript_113279/m.300988 type:complete len:209 (+) Transcript_113279:516-1142(+)
MPAGHHRARHGVPSGVSPLVVQEPLGLPLPHIGLSRRAHLLDYLGGDSHSKLHWQQWPWTRLALARARHLRFSQVLEPLLYRLHGAHERLCLLRRAPEPLAEPDRQSALPLDHGAEHSVHLHRHLRLPLLRRQHPRQHPHGLLVARRTRQHRPRLRLLPIALGGALDSASSQDLPLAFGPPLLPAARRGTTSLTRGDNRLRRGQVGSS